MTDRRTTENETLSFRPIRDEDQAFLCSLYASTRQEEMALTGWTAAEIAAFLQMQFRLQHTQYLQHYQNASFDIILAGGREAGRLYVDRGKSDLRVIDIALLPEFRRQGIGSKVMSALIAESEAKRIALSLHVEMNSPVMPFYERLGFQKKELRGIYYFMERRPGAAEATERTP